MAPPLCSFSALSFVALLAHACLLVHCRAPLCCACCSAGCFGVGLRPLRLPRSVLQARTCYPGSPRASAIRSLVVGVFYIFLLIYCIMVARNRGSIIVVVRFRVQRSARSTHRQPMTRGPPEWPIIRSAISTAQNWCIGVWSNQALSYLYRFSPVHWLSIASIR